MISSKTTSVSSLSSIYHKAALMIRTMALGPVYANQLVSTTSTSHKEVCCILSQLIEMKIVQVTKGATPKYKLSNSKEAIANAELIAAGLRL